MEKDYSKWGYREFWDYLDKNAPACSNRLKKDTPLEIQKAFANYLKWKKEMREKGNAGKKRNHCRLIESSRP